MLYLMSNTGEAISVGTEFDHCINELSTALYEVIDFYMDRPKKQRTRKDIPTTIFPCRNNFVFEPLMATETGPATFISSLLDMRYFLAKRLYQVPQVLKIYSKFEHDIFYTWVVTDERDLEAQAVIYKIEDEMIERFPEFEFDFYTVYALGRDPDLLVDSTLALEKTGDA